MERLRRLRAGISHHDSAERFTKLGIDVFIGKGEFSSANTITVSVYLSLEPSPTVAWLCHRRRQVLSMQVYGREVALSLFVVLFLFFVVV